MKKIMKKATSFFAVAGLVVGVGGAVLQPQLSYAVGIQDGADAAASDDQPKDLQGDVFQTVTDVLLFIIGAVGVIMLIIGGLKYTTSNGDSAAVTSAKNTILYAIIGIIVAILAYAVVHWVIGSFIN